MTKRTKAKRIEAWEGSTAVLHPDGVLELFGGAMVHVRAEAAKTPGARALLVVEADPLARLKEDVVRAAEDLIARYRASALGPKDSEVGWEAALFRAVERLERRKTR